MPSAETLRVDWFPSLDDEDYSSAPNDEPWPVTAARLWPDGDDVQTWTMEEIGLAP
jgi:hypothetical protein